MFKEASRLITWENVDLVVISLPVVDDDDNELELLLPLFELEDEDEDGDDDPLPVPVVEPANCCSKDANDDIL